ncbi:MAG TPA: TIGR02757 family protein [Candidatus Polarisedimenticolaceae bacterium]|nr:TIGR02757 family protein [Candidatus Polarisedimenticolaceae bacterium]
MARAAIAPSELKSALDELSRLYDGRYLDSDPVGIVRRYDDPRDREIVGLLAAGLAYGRVASIRGSLDRLLAILGPRPSKFVLELDPRRDARRFDGFVHRFTRGRDVALFLHLVRGLAAERGLEATFLAGLDAGHETIGPALNAFGEALFAGDARPFVASGRVGRRDGARWLLPLPSAGSACKRSCLFLRWMVRPDDGVDCGVWTRVPRRHLVLPLDVHLQRVVGALGWTRRKTPGWAMALEATGHLRRIDPDDPIRYDFALSRLGILGLLRRPGGRLTVRDVREAFAVAGIP